MANLLIVGGAGYVGSHCAKALAADGHECVVYDDLSRGHREFVRWGPLVEGDVRDASKLADVFRQYRFDAVLHFAALAYVSESVREPERYRSVNEDGTRTLLSVMRGAGVGQLVFSSTCAVYGAPQKMPLDERSPCNPVNPYGQTKLACERMMDEADWEFGLKSVRLRYFNAAGADAGGHIGEWHEPETHLIPLVLGAASGEHERIEIYGTDFPTPDGTAIRDYVHVGDLADAHLKALNYLVNRGDTAVLNVGTGRGTSVREIIRTVESVTGRTVPVREVGRREGDPPELVADAAEAARVLGWTACQGIEQIVKDAWRWHTLRN